METFDKKKHWENIYQTKKFQEVSWYQEKPSLSLSFLTHYKIPKSAKIIDMGGGDSYLVDYLLALGYQHITVLDISKAALERAKKRLGEEANLVTWIEADAANFEPSEVYDFWHDRAAFHFLTNQQDIDSYIATAYKHLSNTGVLIIGTFSENGPTKCSGIDIQQYSPNTMEERLKPYFLRRNCFQTIHETPTGKYQNFTFCSFRKNDLT